MTTQNETYNRFEKNKSMINGFNPKMIKFTIKIEKICKLLKKQKKLQKRQ